MMRGLASLLPGFQHGGGHIENLLGFVKKNPVTGIEILSPSAGYGGMGRKGWLYNQMKLRSALPPQIVAPALFDEVAGEIRIPDVLHLDDMLEDKEAKARATQRAAKAKGVNMGKPQYMLMQHNDIVGNPLVGLDKGDINSPLKYEAGFLDRDGVFLNRREAYERAMATGQVTPETYRYAGLDESWLTLDSSDMHNAGGLRPIKEAGWDINLSPEAWEKITKEAENRYGVKVRMSDYKNITPNITTPSWWAKKGVQTGLPLIGAFLDILLSPEGLGAGTVTREKFTNEERQRLMEANDDLTRQWDSVIGLDSAVDRISNMPHSRVYPRAY